MLLTRLITVISVKEFISLREVNRVIYCRLSSSKRDLSECSTIYII